MFRPIPARAWTPCPRKSRVSPTTLRKSNPASASSTSSSSISRIPSRASTPKSPALPQPPAPPVLPQAGAHRITARTPQPPSPPPPPAPHRAPPPFPPARPPPTPSIPTASATSPAANTISPALNSRTTSSITPTPTSPPTPSSISARLPTPRKPTTSPSPNMKKFSTTIPRASNSPPPASRKAWLSSNSARKPPASANSAKSSSATPAPKKTAAPAPNSKNSPSPSPPPAEILFPIPQLQRSSALLPARQPFNVSPSHFFPIAAKRLRRGQSRFSAPCGTALLRFYGSPRLRKACWEQVGLNGNFLARQQADFRLERLVSGKRYLDAMFSRAHQHAMSDAAEFAGVPHKRIVDKNRGAIGTDIQLDLRCDLGQGGTRSPEHDDLHDYPFFRLDDHLLREVCISGLPNRNLMFPRQKKKFIYVLEFIDVAHVLAVDPHARCFVRLGLPHELHFSQNLVLRRHRGRKVQEGGTKKKYRLTEQFNDFHHH